jgi:hypothetical protein
MRRLLVALLCVVGAVLVAAVGFYLAASRPPEFISLHGGLRIASTGIGDVYTFDEPIERVFVSMSDELKSSGWQLVTESRQKGLLALFTKPNTGEAMQICTPKELEEETIRVPSEAKCVVVVRTSFPLKL